MKQQFNLEKENLKIESTGTLKKTGAPYYVVSLTKSQMSQILALQNKVIKDLKQDEEAFILAKDEAFFTNHLERGNKILGIIADGKLIAQSILLNPSQKYPQNGMIDMDAIEQPDKTSVMQGVIVDPDYRGNKLMDQMVHHWMKFSKQQGKEHLLAEIEVHNFFSWASFLSQGMNLHSIGVDPADGAVLYNAHEATQNITTKEQSLSKLFNNAANKDKIKTCRFHDIEGQKKIFAKGYVCVAFNKSAETLTFVAGKTLKQHQKKALKAAASV